MANAVLTGTCNKSCSYCFAQEHMAGSGAFLADEDWTGYLDLLERSDRPEARLVGGEPTLHPRFGELVAEALGRGLRLLVFTNGLMPARSLEALAAAPEARCELVMNCHEAPDRNAGELERQIAVIQALPGRVALGYNIYRLPFDMDFMLTLYAELPLARLLRVGLALPMPDGTNPHLLPHQYPIAGSRLGAFARRAGALDVRLHLDCGFVRCMFDDAAVAAFESTGALWRSGCSPILDYGSGAAVMHCFALGDHHAAVASTGDTAQAIADGFRARLGPLRAAGIYRECTGCAFRERGECYGGCLSHVRLRFREAARFRLDVPDP